MKRDMQIKTITTLMISAILFTACKQQSDAEQEIQNQLHFRTYIEEDGKLHPVTASRTLAGSLADGYYLSALLTTADYPSTTHDKLMWNVEMNQDGTYKSPTEKKYFWVNSDATLRHSFAAYSFNPTGVATGDGVNASTLAVGSDGWMKVEYTNPNEPAKQIDLLCSDNVHNVKVATSAPIIDLVFKHRLSRLVFKLMGTGNVSLVSCQARVEYKSNTAVKAATVSLSDKIAVDLKNTYHTGTHNLGSMFSMSSSTTTPQAAIEIGDMILLPQNLTDGWLSLTLTYTPENSSSKTASVSIPAIDLSAAAGKQYEVLINVIEYSAQLSVAGVTLTNWNSTNGDIDLEGPPPQPEEPFLGIDYTTTPANSYIAYPDGGAMQGVKFDATKKPRSTNGLGHQGYLGGTESGTSNYYTGGVYTSGAMNSKALTEDLNKADIAKIEVVWQTLIDHGKGIDDGVKEFTDYDANTAGKAFIKKISYNASTGYCSVSLNGTGNALIAAYDAAGTILWSWHIWGTDTKPEATIDPGNSVNGAGKKFMDRNLGALSSTATQPTEEDAYKYFGLLYQWGRKEPFTGAGPQYTTSLSDNINSIPTAIFDNSGTYMTGQGTKPGKLTIGGYTYSGTSAASTYTLLSNPTTHYNGPNTGSIIANNPNTWTSYNSTTVAKSIYDPCPYGYRVPINGSWNDNFPSKRWTANTVNEGHSWKSSWWPAAGHRDRTSAILSEIGLVGNYWSTSPHAAAYYSTYYLAFNYNNGVYPSNVNNRSTSYSVRCIEE